MFLLLTLETTLIRKHLIPYKSSQEYMQETFFGGLLLHGSCSDQAAGHPAFLLIFLIRGYPRFLHVLAGAHR
jgi:hypothetical protein